jgi:hypothetical protein
MGASDCPSLPVLDEKPVKSRIITYRLAEEMICMEDVEIFEDPELPDRENPAPDIQKLKIQSREMAGACAGFAEEGVQNVQHSTGKGLFWSKEFCQCKSKRRCILS